MDRDPSPKAPSDPLGVGFLCSVHGPSGEGLGDLEAVLLGGAWKIRPLQIPPLLTLFRAGVASFPISVVLELCVCLLDSPLNRLLSSFNPLCESVIVMIFFPSFEEM